jgi:hypothetical protein
MVLERRGRKQLCNPDSIPWSLEWCYRFDPVAWFWQRRPRWKGTEVHREKSCTGLVSAGDDVAT